jgi:hypothetical protein
MSADMRNAKSIVMLLFVVALQRHVRIADARNRERHRAVKS